MKQSFLWVLALFGLFTMAAVSSESRQPPAREIAVTFDDLIEAPPGRHSLKTIEQINRKLLRTIAAHKIPAIGFVNESKLYAREGRELAARTKLLKLWTDAGLELGNHTWSHPDLFSTPLEQFKADLVKGEAVTQKLLAERGLKLRYFRHPFLNTGPNLETRTAFEKFLTERGYTIAPVTVDNQEWMFASVYADALEKRDRVLMKRVTDTYTPYIEKMLEHYEQLSMTLFGYEIKQTLLLHDNALNADQFEALAQMMKRRGYRFISLEEALKDKAYQSPDTYAGRTGMSWLERWTVTQNHQAAKARFKLEPKVPEFILEYMNQQPRRAATQIGRW